jgi:MFS family permease
MTFTEGNWTVPLAWIGLYSGPYMLSLGISKTEIGGLASLGIAIQAICTIFGGVLADKLGHKRTVIIFDSLAWPASMLIFAFAQNIWWFITGVVVNSLCLIVLPSWHCIFIEGTPRDKRANVYAILQITMNGSSLLVFIAGMIVGGFGLVAGCRVLYAIAAISMIIGLIYRGKYLVDTEVSKATRCEKSPYNFAEEYEKFKKAFLSIKDRNELFWFCLVQILAGFALVMWNTYASVFYLDIKGLGLNDTDIWIFPFISSVVMISIIIIFIPQVKEKHFKKYLFWSTCLSVIGALLYVITPYQKMSFVAVASILTGCWIAFFRPLSDAYSMNILSDSERARIL